MHAQKSLRKAMDNTSLSNDKHNTSMLMDSDAEETPICWICLESYGELVTPCKCPRLVHSRCLARWQLQSAGTKRERICDFCGAQLPDWKPALTPVCGAQAPAVMNVNFDGRTYSFEVKPGPDGYRMFTESIRRAFNLPDDSELNITFTCDEPASSEDGSLLTLQGAGAYDAAVHCASISAARRLSGTTPSGTPTRAQSCDGGPATPRSSNSMSRSCTVPTPSREEPPLGSIDSASPPASKRRFSGIGRRLRTAFGDALGVSGRQ